MPYFITLFYSAVFLALSGCQAIASLPTAVADNNIRYIDFENGNDSNTGSRDSPWKHHPWDANATASSASAREIQTYVFKKGVTYRGTLVARESGNKDNPIQLTVEEGWGYGPAVLSGSVAYSYGWDRCPEKIAISFPLESRNKIWCRTVKLMKEQEPRLLWEVSGSKAARIPIARMPNWTIVEAYDPRSMWYELDDVIVELDVQVSQGSLFRVGENVSIETRKHVSHSHSSLKVIGTKDDLIQLEVTSWKKGLIRVGDSISNGRSSSVIKKIGGAHTTIRHLVDKSNLKHADMDAYKGATIWAERRSMPKADAAIVTEFNPERHSLQANFHRKIGSGPEAHDRYYLEGLPVFLDSAGEYIFLSSEKYSLGSKTGMLVIRLPGDRDPNESIIEAASRSVLLKIQNQSHIEISGLGFRFTNQIAPGNRKSRFASLFASAVQISGDVTDIKIKNCDFSQLATGIVAYPVNREAASVIDGITITNNSFSDIDGLAIALGNGMGHYKLKKNGSRLIHVTVHNNKLDNIGYRTLDHYGIGITGDGIKILGGEVVEVSANQVDRTWGSGISVTLGSDFARGQVARPFLRGMIHNNKIIDSLLGATDGGGINSWMGGPVYIFNNTSGNPVGCMYSRYKTSTRKNWYRRGCYGVGIYLDGQYKGYVFNNIVWGMNNNANDQFYNSVALNEAMGFMHTVFNNTFYNFTTGLHKGMHQHNRNFYLANLFIDMGLSYIDHEPRDDTIDYSTLAYSKNQFYGKSNWFGKLGMQSSESYKDLNSWKNAMRNHNLMQYDTGIMINGRPVQDVTHKDFMPVKGSPVINAGVRVFVPWALYGVVGEWHFHKRNDNPSIINGENLYMDHNWVQRHMFDNIPRHDLHCKSTTARNFEAGILEDWIPGALYFDGDTRYCTLQVMDSSLDLFNIGSNNFLIEMVVAPAAGITNAGLVDKHDGRGYTLGLDATGRVYFILDYGDGFSQRTSLESINDGKWHHILVDVDRSYDDGITIYVDGEPANGEWDGSPMKAVSISNSAELLVGRSNKELFLGSLDFLRISRGSLADAETNIRELYQWEFDGPFLKDFLGMRSKGVRDVGALEYQLE